jgi:DNA-binding transcriptional ArsR family regulator
MMIFNNYQNAIRAKPDTGSEAKWWETAEDHRFALVVLQLGLRRKILGFIGSKIKSRKDIEQAFDLSSAEVKYHIDMLEKALLVEQVEDGCRSTPTGILYLENVEIQR